jgi:uncharacterized membrane protein YqhA
MVRHLVAGSRYLILIAAVCIFAAATALLLYGAAATVRVVADLARSGIGGTGGKGVLLASIELIDLFLLATVFYVIALGLYELFVEPGLPLPDWLVIEHLDDLKNKLIAVVIVVLGVLFLGQAVAWDGERDLLRYGAAIALVIAALTYFLSQKGGSRAKEGGEGGQPE